jgi:hypothetical protein
VFTFAADDHGTSNTISVAFEPLNAFGAAPKVMVAFIAAQNVSVTSISATVGGIWQRRSGFIPYAYDVETWWADARGVPAGAIPTITAILSGSVQVNKRIMVVAEIEGPVTFDATGSPWDPNGSLPRFATGTAGSVAVPGFSTSSINSLPLVFMISPDGLVGPGFIVGSNDALPEPALPFSALYFMGPGLVDGAVPLTTITAQGPTWGGLSGPSGPPGPYSNVTAMPFALLGGSMLINPTGLRWALVLDAIAGM